MRSRVVSVLVLVACNGNAESPAIGSERAACRAGSGDRCDPGLVCLSDVCVKPPAGDCQAVAETLTSFDLGNYAEPEQRAPVVATYKATCERATVTKDEASCIDKARDKWTASACAPRMFPELASSGTADCAAVRAKIRASYDAQATTFQSDPTMARWFDVTMQVVQQACEQDRWPDAVKSCILGAANGSDALQRCNQSMPPALQQKMQVRMVEAQNAMPR